MKKIVKVSIPENAAKLILLAMNIVAKHIADGVASVLAFINMADLQTQTNEADTQHKLFEKLSRDKETAIKDRDLVLGLHGELIPGTVRFYVFSVRNVLLGIYASNPRHLGDWSFEVNDSMDSGMSVVIPNTAPEMLLLARAILNKHAADGATSVLNGLDMADMQAKYTDADTFHTLSKTLERDAQKASQDRDLALGHDKNQDSYTPGTVLFSVCSVRDSLLGTFRGRERNLGDWGFGVTVSTATPPAPVKIPVTTDQTIPNMLNVNITGNSFSAAAELVITWLLGIFNSAVPVDGVLINFQYLYTVAGIYTFNITGLLTAIGGLQITGANLTAIVIPAGLHISNLDLSNNKLDLDSVYGVIIALDGNGILNGTLNLSGGTNAAPVVGFPALASLIAKGWTVTTN